MTITIDISTVQDVRELLALLETEKEVILTEANKTFVTLAVTHHPSVPENGRVPDTLPQIWISDDFDDELPQKYWVDRKL